MILHMDDHMVHRELNEHSCFILSCMRNHPSSGGHAVFDTVLLTGGYLYQLPEHLDRFKKSAQMAGITLPLSDEAIMRIILDTAAASKKTNGVAVQP